MIHAGELREYITIERPTRTPNGSGGFETTYNEILSTYAKATELSVSNDLIASQENINGLIEFRMRYQPNTFIKIGDRLKWRKFEYVVAQQMKVDPLRTEITITAKAEMETTER